jgi:hypothetical protein
VAHSPATPAFSSMADRCAGDETVVALPPAVEALGVPAEQHFHAVACALGHVGWVDAAV